MLQRTVALDQVEALKSALEQSANDARALHMKAEEEKRESPRRKRKGEREK